MSTNFVAGIKTFGPDYDVLLDAARIEDQHERIKAVMLVANKHSRWLTLFEIEEITGYNVASISAQLRHLRKRRFGSYAVEKQRRVSAMGGTWEYRVSDGAPVVK